MSCSNASLQRAFEDDWHWVKSRQSFATCDMPQFIQNLTKKIVLEVVAVISVLPYPRTWTACRPSVISTQTYWNPRCESVFIQPIPFQPNPLFTAYVRIFLPVSAWYCLFVCLCFDKTTDLSCISIKTDAIKKLLKLFWNYKQTLQTLQVVHVVCANIKRWKTTTQFVFISNSVQFHPYQLIGFVSLGGNSSRFFWSKAVSSVLCHSVLWRFDSCCLQKTQLAIRRQVETTLIQSFWESILLRLTILGSYIDLRHSFA